MERCRLVCSLLLKYGRHFLHTLIISIHTKGMTAVFAPQLPQVKDQGMKIMVNYCVINNLSFLFVPLLSTAAVEVGVLSRSTW